MILDFKNEAFWGLKEKMKIYNCDVCGSLTYFENTICVSCGSTLGYLPLLDNMSSLELIGENQWKALAPQAQGALFKKCQNYELEHVCNWMIAADFPSPFCISCELNETIPDLNIAENRIYWQKLEVAKRRLVYSLLRFGLPLRSKKFDPEKGLAFAFLANDTEFKLKEDERIMIGHDEGKITINVNEANDAIREKMRLDMNERYRTLLGHFRHEVGHYYWFLLIEDDADLLLKFRNVFSDERLDYDEALKEYYKNGPRLNWQENYISAYASSHPWEDWAETWAHYFHMMDALETARSWKLTVNSKNGKESKTLGFEDSLRDFDDLKEQWIYLSTALNSLNRSMGMKDVYPFVWSTAAVQKLRFIQQLMTSFKSEV